MSPFKSGYVGIIGKPNVGKSTLLNHFLGQKLAIVSEKPQTTRTRIQGILTKPNYQIIFVDTPGVHSPKDQLHAFMQSQIAETVEEIDLVLFLVEANEKLDEEDQLALTAIHKANKPTILVINKIDLDKTSAEKQRSELSLLSKFCDTQLISALAGIGCQELLDKIITQLPEGPQYFPEDTLTDRNERFFIGELVREQVYRLTQQEIPYSVAVVTEEVKERTPELTYVKSIIYVERDSQKKILIGTNGKKLKEIGQTARKEVEQLLQKKVYLDLWVKVKKNWRKDLSALKQLGLK
ncbi:MAG: GTPase Era [bacterium]|nr:GTPase Era [bacterium]